MLELCPFGSLSDVLRGSNVQGVERPALKLTLADRMHLALGCALGLAALHNYSPDLCHRDIKSFNFLSKFEIMLIHLSDVIDLDSMCYS